MTTTTAPSTPSDHAGRATDLELNLAKARSILRGLEFSPPEVFGLAQELKEANAFGLARRLFGRIRSSGDYTGIKKSPARVGQLHALCTYKDPDLPSEERFKRALEILDEVDHLRLSDLDRQESCGLRGAVYKRMWQVDGQHGNLERSVGYYLQGYALKPENDQGYTAINAAFMLDLSALEEATQAKKTGANWEPAENRWLQARAIRRELTTLLPTLPDLPGNSYLKTEWWFHSTLAEAHFGLGQFDEAVAVLRAYNSEKKLGHIRPPVECLSRWQLESTISQLGWLARTQTRLAELLSERDVFRRENAAVALEFRQQSERSLRDYLGEFAPGADRAVEGKVGLALSGGGFRASLFHLGVLAYLSERDVLRRVEALSCVSGGSILGAHYYLEVRKLLNAMEDAQIQPEDYVNLVCRLERDFLAGVQRNIRCRAYASIWANLRAFLQPGYTATRRLGELYERELYAKVEDGLGSEPRYLKDLMVKPRNDAEFQPKYDNWRRRAKVPILVLNATALNTGHNWQFTASWMGEPPSSIDSEIEGNYRLRRMYHWEAPRLNDKWCHWYSRWLAPPDYQQFRLGEAVAASSCVPGLFEPLVLPKLYDGKTVRLVDGGVYDNQGTASLLEQDCNLLIVSDASGQAAAQDNPGGRRVGVLFRSFGVSMARVRQAQYRELDARRRSGLLKGLMFLHLKRDLDADPVDWRECQDPFSASDEARPASRRGILTRYGLQKSVQQLLSGIRTDLDSFTEVEAFALMTSGYRQAQAQAAQLQDFPIVAPPAGGWRFLQIEPVLSPGPGYDDLTRQLRVGATTFGKVWRLLPLLTIVGTGLILASLVGLIRLWATHKGVGVGTTIGSLGIFVALALVLFVLPDLMRFIRYRKAIRDVGIRSALMTILAIGLKIHLRVFDPLFLWQGRAKRLLRKRQLSYKPSDCPSRERQSGNGSAT